MKTRIAKLVVRALRRAPIAACLFAGCTCSDKTATVPPTQPPAVAARPTDVPQAAAVARATEPPAEPSPPPQPDIPTPDTARQALCDRYVATLLGKGQLAQLIDDPQFKAFAVGAPDLTMCGAVASDSVETCKRLMPHEGGPSKTCIHMWAMFHELRQYPKGRSFLFDEVDWEECKEISTLPVGICDNLRKALRSGDQKECPAAGDFQSICRAYLGLDTSLCTVDGEVAKLEVGSKKRGETGKLNLKIAFEQACREIIESRKFLAQGLKALAESGPARESELAKAALGESGACTSFAQPAIETCVKGVGAAPAGAAPATANDAPGANRPAGEGGN